MCREPVANSAVATGGVYCASRNRDQGGLSAPCRTHQNTFRDYDPAVGRYVESDPIGLNADVNTYAYVKGDPVALVDPKGLYSSGNHVLMTLSGAQGTCLVSADAMSLALAVAAVDIGTQEIWQSQVHAMCAGG
jgi:RHS repeat-associated protein